MRWGMGPVEPGVFRRAYAIVRAARATSRVQEAVMAKRGRKRSYTFEALFTSLQIAVWPTTALRRRASVGAAHARPAGSHRHQRAVVV